MPSPVHVRSGQVSDAVLVAASVVDAGWPVLAVRPRSKCPLHTGSTRPNHRDAWLLTAEDVARTPGCGFGAVTGQPSRMLGGLALVAIDVDGDGDWSAPAALLERGGPAALAWACSTLRVQRCPTRMHLWGVVEGAGCPRTGLLAPGLEWRGAGGYLLLPGSTHPSGATYRVTGGQRVGPELGAIYAGDTWVRPLPVPAQLLHLIRQRLEPPAIARPARVGRSAPEGDTARRIEGLARHVLGAAPSAGNHALNWAAGVVGAIAVTEPDAPAPAWLKNELVDAYLGRAIPPHESAGQREREARRTVESGFRWGASHPGEALRPDMWT